MDDDQRSPTRHKVFEAATILVAGDAISCTVRHLSDSGAALEVASPIGIPDVFDLKLESGARHCRVIWRKANGIGVRFKQLFAV